ncbi:hypothetical protein [Paraflavitalea speifideaquila]|uniref:hypothetical protein n=1 Tax=Paraflavitalea speifideaquila TaxID=3076558 RepID=UPI0028E7255B|nr:hypothetical protein [Paraflavitalea speifideiaquila]
MSLKKFNPRMMVLLAIMVLAAVVRIVLTKEAKMSPLATLTPWVLWPCLEAPISAKAIRLTCFLY